MKKYIFLLLCIPALLLSGCEKWLDVSPEDQVDANSLFETGDGYRNALHGIYINMASSTLYGQNLTWGLVDVIGQCYKTTTSQMSQTSAPTFAKAAKYQFDDADVKSSVSSIWLSAYNAIANCNKLIQQSRQESDMTKFSEGASERDLILGEALALRAMLHFDLLRLFAPAPAADDQQPYIPYRETLNHEVGSYLTVEAFLKKVEQDLLEASRLVGAFDTIPEHKIWLTTDFRIKGQGASNLAPEDIFFAYRGYRMNYYAIHALMARVYAYWGRYEDAYEMAKEVVDANVDGEQCFEFTSESELATNYKYYHGVIFALTSQSLDESFRTWSSNATQGHRLEVDVLDLYGDSSDDKRGTVLMNDNNTSKKYMNIANGSDSGDDMIPLIRLSEMYYIIGEYYARMNNYPDGCQQLTIVCNARGVLGTRTADSWESFQRELLLEYRKDLLGEGQLFFQYKRMNIAPLNLSSQLAKDVRFVFSRPDNENIH